MSIQGLHHITLVSSDAQRTVDFYTGVLGQRLPLWLEKERTDIERALQPIAVPEWSLAEAVGARI